MLGGRCAGAGGGGAGGLRRRGRGWWRRRHGGGAAAAGLYTADQDVDEVFELYVVEPAAPGVATKLNAPLVAGGSVRTFAVVPAVP